MADWIPWPYRIRNVPVSVPPAPVDPTASEEADVTTLIRAALLVASLAGIAVPDFFKDPNVQATLVPVIVQSLSALAGLCLVLWSSISHMKKNLQIRTMKAIAPDTTKGV
jgi:hypothetical protein